MTSRFTIVGLGEALFDVFPESQVLGGAPLNVAICAHQLAAPAGGRGVVVSRVGQDDLGNQVIAELTARGMDASFVQTDPDHDTGKVYVMLDGRGGHSFEIAPNVAWDWLSYDPDLDHLAQTCEAVCFGTLAQRNAQSRNTIYRFLDAARRATRLFDVNLRQNYFDQHVLARSCELSTVVKLNDQELPVVCSLLGITASSTSEQAAALLKKYKLRLVALTRGEKGTVLFGPEGMFEGVPAKYQALPGADTVGAGDACSAAILLGLLRRWPWQRVADLANHLGAFVASVPGATPQLPGVILDLAR